MPRPMMQVEIRGKVYFESIAELARFIGRPPKSVRASLKRRDAARERIIGAVMARIAREELLAMKAAKRSRVL